MCRDGKAQTLKRKLQPQSRKMEVSYRLPKIGNILLLVIINLNKKLVQRSHEKV